MSLTAEAPQYLPALLPEDLRSQYLTYSRITKEEDAALWSYIKRLFFVALPLHLAFSFMFGTLLGVSSFLLTVFVFIPLSCLDIKFRQKDLEVQRRGLESVFKRRGLKIASDPGGRVEVYRA